MESLPLTCSKKQPVLFVPNIALAAQLCYSPVFCQTDLPKLQKWSCHSLFQAKSLLAILKFSDHMYKALHTLILIYHSRLISHYFQSSSPCILQSHLVIHTFLSKPIAVESHTCCSQNLQPSLPTPCSHPFSLFSFILLVFFQEVLFHLRKLN